MTIKRHQTNEYSRWITGPEGPYLYVHCERAWGETTAQFEARYQSVIDKETRRIVVRNTGQLTVRRDMPVTHDDQSDWPGFPYGRES